MDVIPGQRGGDAGLSFERFADTHAVALTRFAFLLCGERGLAEDLVQDAFVALYRRFGPVLPVAAPVAYARRVIVNTNLSRLRRRRPDETLLADVTDVSDAAVPADATDGAAQAVLWQLLDRLPARQRAVLVLRYYLDQPDAEIAQLMRCREGTVRSLAARAFATLRTHPDLSTLPTLANGTRS